MSGIRRITFVVAALAALTLCWVYGLFTPARGRPNVLVIVVDTLGAEHIGPYSDGVTFTPVLDGLAERGVVFRNAFAAAPWTKPSIASIMTSLSPSAHGVTKMRSRVPDEAVTLAEVMRKHGYATRAVVSHSFLNGNLGYGQGFEQYHQTNTKKIHASITSERVSNKALEWLDELDSLPRDKSFFLFLHYFDPHYIYHEHADHSMADGYKGSLKPNMPLQFIRKNRHTFSPEDVGYLRSLYHEEIAFTDSQIGRVLGHLDKLGLREDTLVVFAADHGEEFMEHGWIGHTRTLYDEVIRIPMIMSLPDGARGRISEYPVSQLDIGPTVLEVAGIEFDGPRPQEGISLLREISDKGDGTPEERTLFSEVDYEGMSGETDARMIAAIRHPLKLIHDRVSGQYELYNIANDPDEKQNLYSSAPELAAPLLSALERRKVAPVSSGATEQNTEMDKKELQQLKTLGYL